MEHILPSSELRNKYSEISNLCRETRQPIYITVNGRGDTVIMNMTEFNKIIAELELLRELSFAEDDVRNNRVKSFDETFDDIRRNLL